MFMRRCVTLRMHPRLFFKEQIDSVVVLYVSKGTGENPAVVDRRVRDEENHGGKDTLDSTLSYFKSDST